ncbi:uncharacterized protein LOC105835900 [Monomorium pharaonis]|uniref:uncharacterized protein LOC105835900 n=1 Tax=Monomorium pharaonis TaxID=307658 RepID=UPI00063F77D4|nr:uncharacterized protein LOC105835900 [Monomorium pharaonis]
MSSSTHEEMIRRISEAQMELKIKLEQVSRLRVDCAKLQLELLKLYKPQCLEILEALQDISAPGNSVGCNGGDAAVVKSRDDVQGDEVHRTSEDVSRKSTT